MKNINEIIFSLITVFIIGAILGAVSAKKFDSLDYPEERDTIDSLMTVDTERKRVLNELISASQNRIKKSKTVLKKNKDDWKKDSGRNYSDDELNGLIKSINGDFK